MASGVAKEKLIAECEKRIRYPDGDAPRGVDRPLTVSPAREGSITGVKDYSRMWRVRLGCNEAGRRLPELIDLEQKKASFSARLVAVEEMRKQAKELAEESKRQERRARETQAEIDHDVFKAIEKAHGPCFPYVRCDICEVSEAVQEELEAAGSDEDRLKILDAATDTNDAPRLVCRAHSGDLTLWSYTEALQGSRW
jgi:hypothetical protein